MNQLRRVVRLIFSILLLDFNQYQDSLLANGWRRLLPSCATAQSALRIRWAGYL